MNSAWPSRCPPSSRGVPRQAPAVFLDWSGVDPFLYLYLPLTHSYRSSSFAIRYLIAREAVSPGVVPRAIPVAPPTLRLALRDTRRAHAVFAVCRTEPAAAAV